MFQMTSNDVYMFVSHVALCSLCFRLVLWSFSLPLVSIPWSLVVSLLVFIYVYLILLTSVYRSQCVSSIHCLIVFIYGCFVGMLSSVPWLLFPDSFVLLYSNKLLGIVFYAPSISEFISMNLRLPQRTKYLALL